MTQDQTDRPKSKPSRFTLAPLYFAFALAVGYFVLTRIIPAMSGLADDAARRGQKPPAGWRAFAIQLSDSVRAHPATTIALAVTLAVAGVVLPMLLRPLRYLVMLLAWAVFLFDVALFGGFYLATILDLANQASGLTR